MKKLFLFLMTFSTLQAMEPQPQKELTLEQLPLDLLKTILFYAIADTPTLQDTYTKVMKFLQTNKQLFQLRYNENFMNPFIDLLYKKFIPPVPGRRDYRTSAQVFDDAIDLARSLKNNRYALLRLGQWLQKDVEGNKKEFLRDYFIAQLKKLNFARVEFLIKNAIFFEKLLAPHIAHPGLLRTFLQQATPQDYSRWLVNILGGEHLVTPLHQILMDLKGSGNTLPIVTFLIEHKANPNTATRTGLTPLLSSIFHNHIVAHYLIEHGADVNKPTENLGQGLYVGYTPLMAAAKQNDLALVKELVAHGANLEARDGQERTALDYATDSKVREYLIEQKFKFFDSKE